ncbi:hypothetical protein NM688_g6555 [Phlebia brevispora]|uniref:Uncharacterized protein n=1 Tax=Phlebia brevispora TaxID=194682 RepID=A0ACC1SER0_9APHY|nr:hypothetical protein NM688_g6555 [Phlebia brevispora]
MQLDATTSSSSDEPFLVAPSPWECKGEFFWLFNYASSSMPYPTGAAFGDLERDSAYAQAKETGEYKGGIMHVMIVRYKDSNGGPYDELAFSPGRFNVPPTGKVAQRVTRIYVSSMEALYNGRKYWNVPKHLAHFTFTPSNASSPKALPYSRITVASLETPDKPFFAVDLTPTMLFSSGVIPFNTRFLPINTALAHPPLPHSLNWRKDGLVGTDRWCVLPMLLKGRAGFFRCKGALEGGKYGDSVGFPDFRPWSVGMWLRDFELELPVGEHLGKKDD